MSKPSKLETAINAIPEEYEQIRTTMIFILDNGGIQALRDYTNGVRKIALALTSEDSVLEPLQDIHDLLSK